MSPYVQTSVSLFKILSVLLSLQYAFTFDPQSICSDVGADVWDYVPCNEYYKPSDCFDAKQGVITLDEFDRCGPAYMPIEGRNYMLDKSGRGETFHDNKRAIRKIKIMPKALRDVSKNSTKVSILGMEIDYPIGLSPVGFQKLANSEGEVGMATGLSSWKTIMVLSSYATSPLEDVAKAVPEGSPLTLWMQLYIFDNRSVSSEIVRKAEMNGYKAIVITTDTNTLPGGNCGGREAFSLPPGAELSNLGPDKSIIPAHDTTFDIITYYKTKSKLPIVAKGILSGSDAIKAIEAGASAIWVSNHGGRQADYAPASIDALPFVVDAVKSKYPDIEVYVDGGFRDGYDVYKGLARGAKMVFMGRPFIWGLGYNGSSGVNQVMDIITKNFIGVMTVTGHSDPSQITRDSLLPQYPTFYE